MHLSCQIYWFIYNITCSICLVGLWCWNHKPPSNFVSQRFLFWTYCICDVIKSLKHHLTYIYIQKKIQNVEGEHESDERERERERERKRKRKWMFEKNKYCDILVKIDTNHSHSLSSTQTHLKWPKRYAENLWNGYESQLPLIKIVAALYHLCVSMPRSIHESNTILQSPEDSTLNSKRFFFSRKFPLLLLLIIALQLPYSNEN